MFDIVVNTDFNLTTLQLPDAPIDTSAFDFSGLDTLSGTSDPNAVAGASGASSADGGSGDPDLAPPAPVDPPPPVDAGVGDPAPVDAGAADPGHAAPDGADFIAQALIQHLQAGVFLA